MSLWKFGTKSVLSEKKTKKEGWKKKREGNQTSQAVAAPQNIIQFSILNEKNVLVDSFHDGPIY